MKTSPRIALLVLVSLVAATAIGAQPPDVVQSDMAGNTTGGTNALSLMNNSQTYSTAFGFQAILNGGNGVETAFGANALEYNTSGCCNSAFGGFALEQNESGQWNTALGMEALTGNISGSGNTAVGTGSMVNAGASSYNTAVGMDSLFQNEVGSQNVAVGYEALFNAHGNNNTGLGASALAGNSAGNDNTAVGAGSMAHVQGSNNAALGNNALKNDVAGNANVAVGFNAGANLEGSNNIAIGNAGTSSDSGVTRIGTAGTQTAVYLAGVATTHVTGASVVVTASGQLGVLASSERYKTAIAPMAARTRKLEELKPVTFHLKSDPGGAVQYGLIAEEVAKVYPELVIRNEAGGIEGVRYDELAPMLLNELKAQARELRELKADVAALRAGLKPQGAAVLAQR